MHSKIIQWIPHAEWTSDSLFGLDVFHADGWALNTCYIHIADYVLVRFAQIYPLNGQ